MVMRVVEQGVAVLMVVAVIVAVDLVVVQRAVLATVAEGLEVEGSEVVETVRVAGPAARLVAVGQGDVLEKGVTAALEVEAVVVATVAQVQMEVAERGPDCI